MTGKYGDELDDFCTDEKLAYVAYRRRDGKVQAQESYGVVENLRMQVLGVLIPSEWIDNVIV